MTEPIRSLDPEAIAARLADVRRRTLQLVAAVEPERLTRQVIPILSPMIWDLGHIANFEEQWLGRELGAGERVRGELDPLFDAVANPRSTRESLPLPTGADLEAYLAEVRERTLEVLAGQAFDGVDPRLVADGFVYEMVAEHEEQHQETLLQAMQVLDEPACSPAERRTPPAPRAARPGMVLVEGGEYEMGWSGPGFAYDNEMARHRRRVESFEIDRYPVTQAQFLRFVEDGGYRRRELWSGAGWAWLEESGAEAPANWRRVDGAWRVRFMDREGPVPETLPVAHVCYHEAEAWCRWAGKRLPTEAEWEKAALWDAAAGTARLFPWGGELPTPERANLDQLAFAPAPVGSYPGGASAYGVEQLLGDVWEWTCSDFTPYPGFEAFPYRDYSEIFFGDEYKVLRGGSWATRAAVARGTFRSWDYPIRRQIFAGFRGARDV